MKNNRLTDYEFNFDHMLSDKVHLLFTAFGCADYLKLSYVARNILDQFMLLYQNNNNNKYIIIRSVLCYRIIWAMPTLKLSCYCFVLIYESPLALAVKLITASYCKVLSTHLCFSFYYCSYYFVAAATPFICF